MHADITWRPAFMYPLLAFLFAGVYQIFIAVMCNVSKFLALRIWNQVIGQFRTKVTNSSGVTML